MKLIPLDQLRRAPGNLWHEAFAAGRLVDGVAVEVPDDFPWVAQPPRLLASSPRMSSAPPLTIPTLKEAIQPQPLPAPAEVAAHRLAICENCKFAVFPRPRSPDPGPNSGHCRLSGCCPKDLSQTVTMALQQCPLGHWPRWLPATSEILKSEILNSTPVQP